MSTLKSIQTEKGNFTIAPFDHRSSLAQLVGADLNTPAGQAALTQLKIIFMQVFSPICSGVLVDPQYGFPSIAYKAPNAGLILTLEASGYGDDKAPVPTLMSNWGVAGVKNNYGVAKLLCYYHPKEKNAVEKKKMMAEVGESCRREGVAFMIEPVIYDPESKKNWSSAEFQEAQLITCQELQADCDLLKLQYPGDALACATMTAELDVPWILLSRGMAYSEFKDAVKIAMENGCKGFAAGRSVWQEIGEFRLADGQPDLSAIKRFLQTTGVERMHELIELVEA